MSWIRAILVCGVFFVSGCASLPDIKRLQARPTATVRFQDGSGPLTRSETTLLQRQLRAPVGRTDILDRHIALEESIVGRPLVTGNKVVLLKDGSETYAAMFAAIRQARDHVNLETYIIDDDEIGHRFADLLIEKQRTGVQINLIYDSVGAIGTSEEFFERLRASGIRLVEFNPINPLKAGRKWLVNNRDHRKLMIVDGRKVFLGGINISGVYSRGSFGKRRMAGKESAWRDTHVQIEGPVVAEFQKLFLETWRKQKGAPLNGNEFFPPPAEVGEDVVHAIGSTVDDPHSLIYLTLLSAMMHAERQIYLTNAYFVPDPQLLQALKDAARRGVDVRLILPSRTDFWIVFHAGRSHYSDLLRAGVKIFERRGAILHSKTALIDEVWSCVGSTNLDWRSFLHNDEVNAVILGNSFAQQMRKLFDEDLAQSDAVDLHRWEQRPLWDRLREWFGRLWEYWL